MVHSIRSLSAFHQKGTQLSKPLNLREYIGVPDVARYLSILFENEFSEADVHRFAFDGHLTLYRVEEQGAMSSRVRPELPDGGIPDVCLVVRTAEVQELERRISNPEKPEKKPLRKRERTTLLIIIAALANLAKIDWKRPSKAASLIAGETERMGARVSDRSILDHLHRIPAALEDRE
jgi:hypothetical protein